MTAPQPQPPSSLIPHDPRLQPMQPVPLPMPTALQWTLTYSSDVVNVSSSYSRRRWLLNGVEARLPAVPFLFRAAANVSIPDSPFVKNLALNTVIDVALVNTAVNQGHSVHMHGGKFWLLQAGSGAYSPANSAALASYNAANLPNGSPLLDTLYLNASSWALIRFNATNPGTWALQSNLDYYRIDSLTAVFVVGYPQLFMAMPDLPICDSFPAVYTPYTFVDQSDMPGANNDSHAPAPPGSPDPHAADPHAADPHATDPHAADGHATSGGSGLGWIAVVVLVPVVAAAVVAGFIWYHRRRQIEYIDLDGASKPLISH